MGNRVSDADHLGAGLVRGRTAGREMPFTMALAGLEKALPNPM